MVDKVIVAGCTHSGLAVMRSLGKHGLYVIGLTHKATDFGLASKYVKEKLICPDPKNETALVEFLLEKGPTLQGTFILEGTDAFAVVLSKHKAELSQYYKMVTPEWPILQQFVEKHLSYEIADACGVPHPKLFFPQSMAEFEEIAAQIQFPSIIKPTRSHEFVAVFGEKSFFVENLTDLRAQFQRTLDAKQAVMIQEVIPGTDFGTLERLQIYINSKGEVSAELFNIKLRQTPPMFGVMRVGASVKPNPEVSELSHRLMQQANYRGYASIEFKRDPRDNQLKFIEANCRMPRSGQMAVSSGVDMPWIIYQDIVHDKQIKVDAYQPTYYIDLVADITNLILRDNKREFSLRDFLRPYLSRHKAFSIFSLSDLRPFLTYVGSRFRKINN
ncbi:MAG: hypothetical protein JXA10_16505 [Anaerolineae bacterium]|nr:hypothetical protein [Anaerolineae bacterium]